MSAAAKLENLSDNVTAPSVVPTGGGANRRVARDFAVLLGIALGIGVIAGIGMMLTVLLIA